MRVSVFAFCVTLLAASAVRAAEDCHLQQLASLPISSLANGDMVVPVTIAGTERKFRIGLTAPYSAIDAKLADEKKLATADTSKDFKVTLDGRKITTRVNVADFSLGSMHGRNFPMLRMENSNSSDPALGGVIGLDVFAEFDVELDLHHQKLNLFSQRHCAGNVVYWASSYAAVPLEMDPLHHFSLRMKLDDVSLLVDLDADQGSAMMGTNSIRRYFGLEIPNLKPNPPPISGPQTYTYPFKTLTLGDITINNPKIDIIPDGKNVECDPDTRQTNKALIHCSGLVDVRLRSSELDALRLYIAFAEKMLYVTPADAQLPAAEPAK